PTKIAVIFNGADESVFSPGRPRQREDPDRFVLISHGTVEERYGLDTIIRAVALLKQEIPGIRLDIYGDGSELARLHRLAEDLDVQHHVRFSDGYVPRAQLVDALGEADAGVVAMKRDAFRDLTLCNKMYDFIAMRKPAIVSRTRSAQSYYDDACFQWFTSDDEHELASAVRGLYANPKLGERIAERAARANEPHRWIHQKRLYLRVVKCVLDTGTGADVFAETLILARRQREGRDAS
ncbi:MAG: glycosyltransferase, partial [Actinomycetota bacterium]|nr:glycosyltransferase [Actinomycetota bacterium]